MTSSPICSRAMRKNTAPFTAPFAMQHDMPRSVTWVSPHAGTEAFTAGLGLVERVDLPSARDARELVLPTVVELEAGSRETRRGATPIVTRYDGRCPVAAVLLFNGVTLTGSFIAEHGVR